MTINISISNKRPTVIGTTVIVCGNSGYSIDFSFDAEWTGSGLKTARFVYVKGGAVQFQEVAFSGNTVQVPILSDIREVYVGVYAGDLQTTTPARIPCDRSILCGGGVHEDPPEDVYNQILALLNESDLGQFTGHIADHNNPHGVTAVQVGAAPASHVQERNNPHGVTAEQVGARPSTWMPTAAQVGAVSKTLLWENASPTSEFADQELPVPLAGYDAIEIVFLTQLSSSGRLVTQTFYTDAVNALGNVTGLLFWTEGYSYAVVYSRTITLLEFGRVNPSMGGIVFSLTSITNNTYTDVNRYVVPVRIYGIKGVQ